MRGFLSLYFSGRGNTAAAFSFHRRAPERWPESKTAAVQPLEGVTGSNAPLDSLAGGSLASRFHAWRGASGRRYIFSVFGADRSAPDAGLPDFAEAIALAVARDDRGSRRCVALCLNEATTDPATRQHFVAAALAAGAVEWHIHLLAEDPQQRRAIAKDIECGRFAEASTVR